MSEQVFEREGWDELEDFINRFPEIALDAAEPAMMQALLVLHGAIPEYPAPLPGQKYKRRVSAGLGGSWTENVIRATDQVSGEIGTNVPYAPWVVGPGYPGEVINGKTMYQAQIHEGRWFQFYDVMEGAVEEAWETFDEALFDEITKAFAED